MLVHSGLHVSLRLRGRERIAWVGVLWRAGGWMEFGEGVEGLAGSEARVCTRQKSWGKGRWGKGEKHEEGSASSSRRVLRVSRRPP